MNSRHEKSEGSNSFRTRCGGRVALCLLTIALLPFSIVPAFAQDGMEKVALVETADISLGISATPLGNHALSQYRGTGERGVTPGTPTQHVAVILWDERSTGGSDATRNAPAGYGSNQVSNIVNLHVR